MLFHEMNNTLEQILQILDGFSQDWTFSASGKYAQANFAYLYGLIYTLMQAENLSVAGL